MSNDATAQEISETQIVRRDPTKLKLAPMNKHIIRLTPGSVRFNALVEDIKENGIQDALLIDKDGYVYEGWTRREIALDLQLKTVPCKVCVTEENAHDIVWRYTIRRKNLTLGQMAYCLAPTLEEAFAEAKVRRSKNAVKTKSTEWNSFPSVKELAAAHGVSYQLLNQAQNLYKIWEEHPEAKKWGDAKRPLTLREKFEPEIMDMDDPTSLGGALKGIGFLLAYDENDDKGTGGKPKGDVQKQLNLFTAVVDEGIERWDYYTKWTPKVQDKHWSDVRVKAAALKPDKAAGLAEYYYKLAAEYEKVAKAAKKEGK